jgi:hypothetical protein
VEKRNIPVERRSKRSEIKIMLYNRMTSTQDLFIDSESTGSYNNFDIHLPHPIIIEEDEKAYICLKDFQQLNSIYNISSDLQNNTFGIVKTERTYFRTPSGTPVAYFNNTDLFSTTGIYTDYPITNPAWDGVAHTETITPNAGDYTIRLYDPTITTTYANAPITSVKLRNIFRPTAETNYTTFAPDDYIIYYNKTTPTSGRFMDDMTFSIMNVASALNNPTNAVYITLKLWSSIDGITWVQNAVNGGNPTIGFNVGEWTYTTTRATTFTVSVDDTYSYHRVSFDPTGFASPADMKTKIRFKQLYLRRSPSFTENFTDGVVLTNYTIEDGAYSLTNLNLYLNYLLRLNVSPNLAFTTSYPSQPFLTAQNKHILAWSSTEPAFIYTSQDKTDNTYQVEITFNATLKKMLGWVSSVAILKNNTPIEATNYINLINFKKIVLTSSLQLTTKPYTFLNKTYTKSSGIGDIFAWISKDIAPFQYINWTNTTDAKIEIDDKLITKINFKLTNEYLQVLNDIPPCNFHLQIIIEKKEK